MTAAALPVDTSLLRDIRRYGAADVTACFSCGVCTATCPLVGAGAAFPRRIIRYAEVGLRDKLLASPELWACYACGECSDSCPTQAEPSEFMAAARRYAIARYDRTGLARLMYTHPWLGTIMAVVIAAFFALFMYASHGPMSAASLEIFGFIPEPLIHDIGVVLIVIVFLAGLLGIASMARRIARDAGMSLPSLVSNRVSLGRSAGAAWQALAVEALGQRRYRADCESAAGVPFYRRRWFIHAATMWGFLGLLAATILDYGLALLGIRQTGTPVPIWYSVRLLGTLAGVLMIYGVTMLAWRRARRADRSLRTSSVADWTFLALLEIAGLSGFALELALYLPSAPAWGYWVFLFHVSLAMELVLLAPFMKFAHAIYRPVALFFLALAGDLTPTKQRPTAEEVAP